MSTRPTDARCILDTVSDHHDKNVGYVVYRCTYGDDQKWAQFMAHLSAFVDAMLTEEMEEDEEAVRALKECFAWTVQDDEAKFKNASMRAIRQHFNEWTASVDGLQSLTKYTNCIYADEEVVDAVLSGDPQMSNVRDRMNPKAYVKILDYQFRESPRQWSADDIDDEGLRQELNAGDEGFAPVGIEACRRKDVGWMKVSAHVLMSRAYKVLMSDGWFIYYRRPPAAVHD